MIAAFGAEASVFQTAAFLRSATLVTVRVGHSNQDWELGSQSIPRQLKWLSCASHLYK